MKRCPECDSKNGYSEVGHPTVESICRDCNYRHFTLKFAPPIIDQSKIRTVKDLSDTGLRNELTTRLTLMKEIGTLKSDLIKEIEAVSLYEKIIIERELEIEALKAKIVSIDCYIERDKKIAALKEKLDMAENQRDSEAAFHKEAGRLLTIAMEALRHIHKNTNCEDLPLQDRCDYVAGKALKKLGDI